MTTLVAKPVVKGQYWIVTNGKEKVGNVLAAGSGYELKLHGNIFHFEDTKSIEKQAQIEFENLKKSNDKSLPYKVYPTTSRVYNSILDVKRKLHLFTKSPKSKCYHAAGWYVIKQGEAEEIFFCPKYIFIQRYPFKGPFKTEEEAKTMINS
jgi:hypothetical protein